MCVRMMAASHRNAPAGCNMSVDNGGSGKELPSPQRHKVSKRSCVPRSAITPAANMLVNIADKRSATS